MQNKIGEVIQSNSLASQTIFFLFKAESTFLLFRDFIRNYTDQLKLNKNPNLDY